jgi:hypothetical protein
MELAARRKALSPLEKSGVFTEEELDIIAQEASEDALRDIEIFDLEIIKYIKNHYNIKGISKFIGRDFWGVFFETYKSLDYFGKNRVEITNLQFEKTQNYKLVLKSIK